MDNGFPFTTEPNALKEMIAPPSMMRTLTSAVTGQANNVSGEKEGKEGGGRGRKGEEGKGRGKGRGREGNGGEGVG